MTFKDLDLIEPILKALEAEGYTHPTPIQEQSIPILLQGKDLLGCAQTGTGKTAAFGIPILQLIYQNATKISRFRKIKALVVTPTRELAIQIAESFTAYGRYTGIKNTVVFGGVKQGSQVAALRKGVDILVATPGRLLDLMNQGFISLRDIEYFVLDEADQMLDMGFIHDIKKLIAKLPKKRQSLFFSATMPPNIVKLSREILGKPEKVTVKPEQTTAEKVEQAVYFVRKPNKIKLLVHLFQSQNIPSMLVFSRTKHGANKIVRMLEKANIHAEAIHGNKSQVARQRALNNFKAGQTKVLVATDIAARGIDVDELSYVVNYDLPNVNLFAEQVAVFKEFLAMATPDAAQKKDIDFLMAMGELFALVVYAQLVLENAKIYAMDEALVDQIFDFMVRDFSKFALQLYGKPSSTAEQMVFCQRMLRKAVVDEARYQKVWQEHVYSLKDVYEMNP